MNEQQREIVKSLAYGVSVEQIAVTLNIDISEVLDIENTYSKNIQDEKDYLKEMEMM